VNLIFEEVIDGCIQINNRYLNLKEKLNVFLFKLPRRGDIVVKSIDGIESEI
jgi:hypothetical protein